MLTEERLKQIEERAAKATPGPWRFERDFTEEVGSWEIRTCVEELDDPFLPVACAGHCEDDTSDAAFIAAARTDVPDLVAEVQKLHSVLTELLDLWNIAAIVPKWISGSPHPALGSRVGPAWTAAREALGREG